MICFPSGEIRGFDTVSMSKNCSSCTFLTARACAETPTDHATMPAMPKQRTARFIWTSWGEDRIVMPDGLSRPEFRTSNFELRTYGLGTLIVLIIRLPLIANSTENGW